MKKIKIIAPLIGVSSLVAVAITSLSCCSSGEEEEEDFEGHLGYALIGGEKVFFDDLIATHICLDSGESPIEQPNITLGGTNYPRETFNYKIALSKEVTDIGQSFLSQCTNFNSQVVLPKTLRSIDDGFLIGCHAFNQPLSLPSSLTDVGTWFLNGCSAFNQKIVANGLKHISEGFMANCTSFNSSLSIPKAEIISMHFLLSCTAFNKPISLPNSLTNVGYNFMKDCKNMTSTVNINNLSAEIFAAPAGYSTLATTESDVPLITEGVTIKGTNKAAFMSRFPNSLDASPYRHLK